MTSNAGLCLHARRAAATYGAAADHYTAPPLGFWDRFGAETVRRLAPAPGSTLLDACCGAGASALAAARSVVSTGRVLGVDVAEPLLQIARRRAAAEGLDTLEFRCADATRTGLPDGSFDAVVCVFGVFFVPDMPAFVREMARLVRRGGPVAITTWGTELFEPGNGCFWEAVRDQGPCSCQAYIPWDEVATPCAVADLLRAGGLVDVAAKAVPGAQPLRRPEDFWDIVLGSGYRAAVDALPPVGRGAVRARLIGELRARSTTSVRTDVVFGTGRRPSG